MSALETEDSSGEEISFYLFLHAQHVLPASAAVHRIPHAPC